MNKLTAVAAAMVISTLAATPVFAQADVLNGGAPTPAAKLSLEPPAVMQAYAARESGLGKLHARRGSPITISGDPMTATTLIEHDRCKERVRAAACTASSRVPYRIHVYDPWADMILG